MRVRFSATGSLREYVPGSEGTADLEMASGATVTDLLRQLGVTWGEVGIIVVNGQIVNEGARLREGDRVELIAPLGGGAGRAAGL